MTASRSTKHEDKIMKRHGGRRNPSSGSVPGWEGDGGTDTHLAEIKYTDKKQFTLKLATLRKIEGEALAHKKNPALILTFYDGRREFTYVVIPEGDFLELKNGRNS